MDNQQQYSSDNYHESVIDNRIYQESSSEPLNDPPEITTEFREHHQHSIEASTELPLYNNNFETVTESPPDQSLYQESVSELEHEEQIQPEQNVYNLYDYGQDDTQTQNEEPNHSYDQQPQKEDDQVSTVASSFFQSPEDMVSIINISLQIAREVRGNFLLIFSFLIG